LEANVILTVLMFSVIGVATSKFGIGVVSLAVGIGLGRIKNSKKLAAAKSVLDAAESKVGQEAKSVIAAVRSQL
jgi:hypothetical protein